MALHDRAGDAAVEVEVADQQLALRALERDRAAREETAGQRILDAVPQGEGVVEVLRTEDREDGGGDFLARERGVGLHVDENRRRHEVAAARGELRRELRLERELRLAFALVD